MKSFTAEAFFSPRGPLAKSMGEFEERKQQVELAEAISRSLEGGGALLAEAGTGTGKTLGYLFPTVTSGQRVTISTGTKNLQDQILEKDLPLLEKALGRPVSHALLKGRSNYLCLHRFEQFRQRPEFDSPEDGRHWAAFEDWAETTSEGIRGQWKGLPEFPRFWPRVDARAETCLGQKCGVYEQCHLILARQEAAAAQVVVVNHHLLFADLAVKARGGGQDFGVLPDYGHLVLDEAHLVEDIAGPFFGGRVSSRMWQDWLRDFLEAARSEDQQTALLALHEGLRQAVLLWGSELGEDFDRTELRQLFNFAGKLRAQCEALVSEAGAVLTSMADLVEGGVFASLETRLNDLRQNLAMVLEEHEDSDPQVRWASRRRGNFEMVSCPVNVGELLGEHLYPQVESLVMTSATMSTGRSFDYLKQRLDLNEAEELVLDSPYDHRNCTALYLPDLPLPNEPGFRRASLEEMEALVELSNGGAFLLFASHNSLQAAAEFFRERSMRSLYIQGSLPRNLLLDEFREDGEGVLLGTTSFWQGVDVRGSALRLVVIEKIPFAVPDDPLVAARRQQIEAKGGNAFMEYQVPQATLLLKQGLGRLLRSHKDQGLLAILDSRLSKRRYGKTILDSLPETPRVSKREDLEPYLHLVRV